MAFYVVNVRTNEAWPDADGNPKVYETGKDAEEAASNIHKWLSSRSTYANIFYCMTADTDHFYGLFNFPERLIVHEKDKWQPRKINTANGWRDSLLSEQKSWKPLPWAAHNKWLELIKCEPFLNHFTHMAGSYVRFFKNEEDAKNRNFSKLLPRDYLEKYLSNEFSSYIDKFLDGAQHLEFKIAQTREEIRWVYENGPASCMKGKPSRWFRRKNAPHPCEVYATKKTGVAYLKRGDKVTARAVVRTDEKTYPHIYGDESVILSDILKGHGYTLGDMEGANLLFIPGEEAKMTAQYTAVVPYVDGALGYYQLVKEGNEEFVYIHPWSSGLNVKGAAHRDRYSLVAIDREYVCAKLGKTFRTLADRPSRVYNNSNRYELWSPQAITNITYKNEIFYCPRSKRYWKVTEKTQYDYVFRGHTTPQKVIAKKSSKDNFCYIYGIKVESSSLMSVVVAVDVDGTEIVQKVWIKIPQSQWFTFNDKIYMTYLASKFPLTYSISVPIHFEHEHCKHVPKLEITEKITRENAHKFQRDFTWDHEKQAFVVKETE